MLEFDPYSYDVHEDPYPIYKRLRDEAPAYWNDRLGFWALSRHADVLAGFKDPVRFSSAGGVSLERSSQIDPSSVAFFIAMDDAHLHAPLAVATQRSHQRVAL